MESTILTELPIIPEKYETEMLDAINWSTLHSLMCQSERAFVNGLIRYYKPHHVLELGVNCGGGTVNILNALNDLPESILTSIDIAEYIHNAIPVGADVKTIFPELPANKWELFAGKEPSEVFDLLGKTFDFAVIDTAHLHPIESLNYLCALPYLQDGAIVILHDTALGIYEDTGKSLAPRILFSSVVAPKIEPDSMDKHLPANIAAFQITQDTRKYVGNIFESLFLPWRLYPGDHISSVRKLLSKHYPAELTDKFDMAANLNKIFAVSEGQTYHIDVAQKLFSRIPSNTVFYGAGWTMKCILRHFKDIDVPFNYAIWDQNRSIYEMSGHAVTAPDFETKVKQETIAIVTICDDAIFKSVNAKLESLGYTVFHGFEAFLKTQG